MRAVPALVPALLRTRRPFLIDGPLMLAPERRAQMRRYMADHLTACGIPDNDDDARRLLLRAGYSTVDVDLLAADARMDALEAAVGAVMAEG